MIAKQHVYTNLERTKAFPDGHAEARLLLVRAGQEIEESELQRYEGAEDLADTEAEKKEMPPIPPPTLKNHGDTGKTQSIPQPKIKGDKEAPSGREIAEKTLPAKVAKPQKSAKAKKPRK